MEDPFLIHIARVGEYYNKKIKELDEKMRFINEEMIIKKQIEMEHLLEELEKDMPPKPDDGISFKALRNEKSKESGPTLITSQFTMTPKRLNSEILPNPEISQSSFLSKEYQSGDKNVRHSDILSNQPKGIRSVSQNRSNNLNEPLYKTTQSTIERTTIIIKKNNY